MAPVRSRSPLRSVGTIQFPGNNRPKCEFPSPDAGHEKFNSRLVAPTNLRDKPFGENVEGLFHFRDESCAVEDPV